MQARLPACVCFTQPLDHSLSVPYSQLAEQQFGQLHTTDFLEPGESGFFDDGLPEVVHKPAYVISGELGGACPKS